MIPIAVYFIMLAATVGLAAAAVFFPAQRRVLVGPAGRGVVIRQRSILFFLAFLPMLLVSGLRWYVGVDYNNYAWIFKAINRTDEKTHVEAGYRLLNQIVGWFTQNPEVLFFVTSAIIVFFFARGILDNSCSPPYSVFLFIALGFFFYSMNSIRHFMALSLFFFALKYMRRGQFGRFALCILAASGFHKIALIALPLYFLFTRRFKFSYYAVIAVFLAIFAVFNKPILNLVFTFVYSSYQGSVYNVYSFSAFNVLLCGICTLLAFLYYRPLLERSRANIIYINAAVFTLLFYLFCGWIPTPSRIGQYGTVLFVLLIPEILAVEKNKRTRLLLGVGFGVFAFLFMAVMLLRSNDPTLQLLPYQTIFDPR